MDRPEEFELLSPRLGASLAVAVAVCLLLPPPKVAAGDLAGHVFIRTAVGEARRIADLQVVLIPATPAFEAAWREIVGAFERERRAALEALRQAENEKAAAQAEYLRLVGPGAPAFAEALAREGRALRELERAKKAVAVFPVQFPERAKTLIRHQQGATVRTGVDGQYRFSDIAAGKCYVFSEHEIVEQRQIRPLGAVPVLVARFVWFVPVTVTRQAVTLDLASSNSG